MTGRLAIIGSGETAPTMVKIHRELLTAAELPAMLDTPFGFQVNADDLTDKILGYFRDSVGRDLAVGRWRRADEPVAERERTLAGLSRADYAFAGPGSPSYALRQWRGTPVPGALAGIVERGGTLVMGSAAAVTLGARSIPVYEIYKVGTEPYWEDGLDLLGALTGLRAAVVPHYDNREGGRHDTRYCYLGEERLRAMEAELPDDLGILGVDEHTAAIIDRAAGTVSVHGSGTLVVRRRGESRAIPAGETVDLAEIAALLDGSEAPGAPATPATVVRPATGPADPADASRDGTPDQPSLESEAAAARARFDERMAAGDAEGALTACLELEDAIESWSADTLDGAARSTARGILRGMIVDLAGAATTGLRDEREVLGPFLDIALEVRQRARAARDFELGDLVRDRLADAGIEVRDTPDGPEWNRLGA